MSVIYKYQLLNSPIVELEIPEGAEILCVQTQREVPCMWVRVDKEAPLVKRKFRSVATGCDFNSDEVGDYIGTIQSAGEHLVFHIFEVVN